METQISEPNSSEQVILEVEGPLAVLRLGSPNERVIVLTLKRMESLSAAIKSVATDPRIEGLVIIGANPSVFCAGADIGVIKSVTDPRIGRELAERGQKLFSEIEALNCTTVAAISGACVGGGCELALACKYRVITDSPQSRIGLPEVRLGILPGFGGTQRLPRLVGLTHALDIILKGRLVSARRAYDIGLVDDLGSSDPGVGSDDVMAALEARATDVALNKVATKRKSPGLLSFFITNIGLGRSVVFSKAKAAVLSETKGNYPAPIKALECVFYGLRHGESEGYKKEAEALGELIVSRESKSLVHLHNLSEDAAKLGRSAKINPAEQHVTVLGAGTMGAGIANSFLQAGLKVTLYDPFDGSRLKAKTHIEGELAKQRGLTQEKRTQLLSKLEITDQLTQAKGSTFVIEAVIEDLKVKRELLSKIAELVDVKTIIASNTSSLSISEIAAEIKDPNRIIGMHFFNPVEKMPLLEIVWGKKTDERTIVYTAGLTGLLGKSPIVVQDVAGFLVNRILGPYLVEAAQLLSDGHSVTEIDDAAVAFGMPMGPIRLLDEVGLDVASKVTDSFEKAYGERMKGPRYAAELVSKGRLGRKAGKGFYLYDGKSHKVDDSLTSLLNLPVGIAPAKTEQREIIDRLVLSMVNEAVRSLDEGVAGEPGREAAGQIDLGSVMGLGFAPFRGGVIHYAESLGAQAVQSRLEELKKRYGKRFTPCHGIIARAEKSRSFYSA